MFADLSLEFHREPVHAWLFCRGESCWFEVWVHSQFALSVQLEILLQLRSRSGLPRGVPRSLYVDRILLDSAEDDDIRRGRVTLPYRLSPELLETCHWRVTPCTNRATADESHP